MLINVEGRKLPKTKKRAKVVEAQRRETGTKSRQQRLFSALAPDLIIEFLTLNSLSLHMKKIFKYAFIFIFGLNLNLFSGPFTDEFAKCIVMKTTTQEKTDLVRWIYVTMSFHPQLMDLSNLTADDVEMVNIRVADYMTNVFAYKCNEELNMAIDYEGEESVYYAFELLGEIAMTELMEDQGVSAASELFIDYIDVSIFEQILNY